MSFEGKALLVAVPPVFWYTQPWKSVRSLPGASGAPGNTGRLYFPRNALL